MSLKSNRETVTTPVVLVGVDFGHPYFDVELSELSLLAKAAGLKPVICITCKRKMPDAALFIGSGKADEIKRMMQEFEAHEVLFDQSLSPAQQRNLERYLDCPVNDRTLLILEIFAKRARSHEGKLQVELARLQYLSTRLVRRWSHLERQKGGIGNRGGPGERQIELDRRMITAAITRTKDRLGNLKRQRATQRKQRIKTGTFAISLVGYTNAGKSSLFNTLVKAHSYAVDQLFATLDTTTRQLYLGQTFSGEHIQASLSDTVGFIRDLPHGLIEAFEATLQEVRDADLLLHVVDVSTPTYLEQIAQVQKVLREIDASNVPQILIFNKMDALSVSEKPDQSLGYFELDGRSLPRLYISALTGQGVSELRTLLLGWIESNL